MIQVLNLIVFCWCHFWKVKYIGNNILKYLSLPLKLFKLINQHVFFHFQNLYFSSVIKWSKSTSLYRDILTWISLPLRHTENGSWNVIKYPLYGSVYAMPISTQFLLDQDDEILDIFMLVCDFYEEIDFSKFEKYIYQIKWNKNCQKWGFTTSITIHLAIGINNIH